MKLLARRLSYEDVHLTSIYLAECATHVLIGINGVLQDRVSILDLDLIQIKENFDDYNQNNSKNQNLYYQKQTVRIEKNEKL